MASSVANLLTALSSTSRAGRWKRAGSLDSTWAVESCNWGPGTKAERNWEQNVWGLMGG